jgi:hypothetical protein
MDRRTDTLSKYQFVSKWSIPAPLEQVWDELMTPEQWPTWWRGVEKVELLRPGIDVLGTGAVRRYTWRSRLPYRLTFVMDTTCIDPQTRIEGRASGELEGFGCWHLAYHGQLTHVQYDWQVEAIKPWMRWLAPLARPLFEWNHDVVMKWGEQGLTRRLSANT